MILVVLAGYIEDSGFFDQRTLPLLASITIAVLADTSSALLSAEAVRVSDAIR